MRSLPPPLSSGEEVEEQRRRYPKELLAVNLLREGMAYEAIARVTGLTVERVQQLQAGSVTGTSG